MGLLEPPLPRGGVGVGTTSTYRHIVYRIVLDQVLDYIVPDHIVLLPSAYLTYIIQTKRARGANSARPEERIKGTKKHPKWALGGQGRAEQAPCQRRGFPYVFWPIFGAKCCFF